MELPALQINPPGNPLDSYAKAQQIKLQQQALQQGQMQNQQMQADMQEQQAVQTILGKYGNIHDALPELSKSVRPKTFLGLQKADMDARKELADINDKELQARKFQLDQFAGLYQQVMAMPDDQYAQSWPQIVQAVQKINPQVQLPQQPVPKQQLQSFGLGLMLQDTYLKAEAEKRAQQAASREQQLFPSRLAASEAGVAKTQAEAARVGNVPGVDVPFSPEVQRQKVAIAGAMAAARRDTGAADDIDVAARALIDPRNLTALKDVVSMRGDQRLKVFARARQLDPNFDPGLVQRRVDFLKNYENPSGRAALNRQAINNILQHAGDLAELNEAYRRSNVRLINTPLNKIANQFGNQDYTRFATTNAVLKDELALYFAGGYAPQQDQLKMWNKIQSDEATPAQTEAFVKEVVHLGVRRANTFNSQFHKVMGYDDPNMIIPEAADAAERLGMGHEIAKFGSGGGYYKGQPQQQGGGQPKQLTDINKAREYLQRAGGDKAKARQLAQQDGWTF